ncbi:MAG: prepilin-type N-terminal cleavage/methylation domain-containing protein [Patescibacteria group bacterium]
MKTRGFTLIELLITTTIFLAVFGFALASWSSFRQRAQMGAIVNQLASELISIRSRAMAGNRPNDSDCLRFEGYQVSAGLEAVPYCYQDEVGIAVFKQLDYTEDLLFDDSLIESVSGFPLLFESLSGSTSEAYIILRSNDQVGRINISQSGEISTTFPYVAE